ncbi:MAG: hypothetical protein WBQ85_00775 [Candidatus Sulfotelmatobacter sp.]
MTYPKPTRTYYSAVTVAGRHIETRTSPPGVHLKLAIFDPHLGTLIFAEMFIISRRDG